MSPWLTVFGAIRLPGRRDDGAPLSVDLEACHLIAPDGSIIPFEVDPTRRQALLQGLDDIELTLKDAALITDWQNADRLRRPWAWPGHTAL